MRTLAYFLYKVSIIQCTMSHSPVAIGEWTVPKNSGSLSKISFALSHTPRLSRASHNPNFWLITYYKIDGWLITSDSSSRCRLVLYVYCILFNMMYSHHSSLKSYSYIVSLVFFEKYFSMHCNCLWKSWLIFHTCMTLTYQIDLDYFSLLWFLRLFCQIDNLEFPHIGLGLIHFFLTIFFDFGVHR